MLERFGDTLSSLLHILILNISKMNATINVTELADELTTKSLRGLFKQSYGDDNKMYRVDETGVNVLTEQAQDYYNQLHDLFEEVIMNCKTKEESTLERELRWWRDYGYYVSETHYNVNDKACEWANNNDEDKYYPNSC